MLFVEKEEGKFEGYSEEFDVVIHCKTEEEQREVSKILKNVKQWIPVSERLPEDAESNGELTNYLIWVRDYGVDIGNYIDSIGKWVSLGIPADVIAWMPLPEPYKEEGVK